MALIRGCFVNSLCINSLSSSCVSFYKLAAAQYILNMSSESDPEDTFSSFTQTTAPTEWGSELQAGHMDRDDDSFSVGVLYVSYNPNGQGSPRIFDLELCARAAADRD